MLKMLWKLLTETPRLQRNALNAQSMQNMEMETEIEKDSGSIRCAYSNGNVFDELIFT